jgi:hypothetical protein
MGAMSAAELEPIGDQSPGVEGDSEEAVGLTDTQIQALNKLHELDAQPRKPDEPYSRNPQVRAYQMMYEGRLGGPGRGQGRKRKPRAAEHVAREIREKLAPRIFSVLKEALEDDNVKVRLQAADMALDIERQEAKLSLDEDKTDAEIDKMNREQLVAELITLVSDPATQAALGGYDADATAIEEVTDAEVVTEVDTEAEALAGVAGAAGSAKARDHSGIPRSNGRGNAASNRPKRPNPWTQAAKRRSAERR